MKYLLIFVFLFAFATASVPLRAQPMKWKIVAPLALFPMRNGSSGALYGAIAAKGRIIVAGWKNVLVSPDTGRMWRGCTPPGLRNNDYIGDIAIYDDQTFAIMTGTSGAFVTYDQGLSWQLIAALGTGSSIVFDGSPSRFAMTFDNIAYGQTLNLTPVKNSLTISYVSSLRVAADGSLRLLGAADGYNSLLYSSYDHAASWVSTSGLSGGDVFSFLADAGNPNRFIVINENWYFLRGQSYLNLTTDNGNSWTTTYSDSTKNYALLNGSSATGCHDYFVGTMTKGVLRSADKGLTWQFAGGPAMGGDCRSIAAFNDSLLFALDTLGSIWSTDAAGIDASGIFGGSFFQQLNIHPCDTTVIAMLHFEGPGCSEIGISSFQILGADASQYAIVGSLPKPFAYPDSIGIRFTPSQSGKTDAHLKVLYANGASANVDLSVNVAEPALSISESTLFGKDTLFSCTADSVTLILSARCPLAIDTALISGPDAASFILLGKKSRLLPQDSVLKIHCLPQHIGNLNATLHLVASDGRVWNIPLLPVVAATPLFITPALPFLNDTIASCSADSSIIFLSAPCSLDITSMTVTGADAASFILAGNGSASLPADSLFKIQCIPKRSGKLTAALHIVASDGRSWDIPLTPFVISNPLFFTPSLPFGGDTILQCFADTAVMKFLAPCTIDLTSLLITGADASSFSLSGKNSATLPADSLLEIVCRPQHLGKLTALLHVVSSDGRAWDIPLGLFVKESALQFQPATLFAADSLEFCSSQNDTLKISSACGLDLSAITVTGADAVSFALKSNGSATIPQDSTIIIQCIPQHSGQLSAAIHIVTSGGVSFDIPLLSRIRQKPTLAFDRKLITGEFTDIIGGDVSVPIAFIRSGSAGKAEFRIRFDTSSLIYRGTFDAVNVDHTVGILKDHEVNIAINASIDTLLFARFSFYPVDSACTHITIDSLIGEGAEINCLTILTDSAEAEICSPQECGRQTLARFEKNGTMPQLSVAPNPGSGIFTVTCSKPIGFVTITILDKLGVIRRTQLSELSATQSATLNLESLPSGAYFIRVSGIPSVVPVVLEK